MPVEEPLYPQATRELAEQSEEIMEAICVAAEMRAGAACAHSALALDVIGHRDPGAIRAASGPLHSPVTR